MSEFAHNLAVVIGINAYSHGISPLQTAVDDAKTLACILQQEHGYRIGLLLDQKANLQALNRTFEEALPKKIEADDRLLFYFAGHGIALNGQEGPEGYLLPQDAQLGNVSTYLSMHQLNQWLTDLPCRHVLVILDCCFAGAFRWSSVRDIAVVPELIHKERYDRFIIDPAWQVLTSAASDQKAIDFLSLSSERGKVGNHSPFAAALFKALKGEADAYPPAHGDKERGDGVITATELYLYLRDSIELTTEKYNKRQTPGLWCLSKHDKGEYIFLVPGRKLDLPSAPPLDASQNPYRGLESYEPEHSTLFFGRTALIEKLYDAICDRPLTVVLGASGSGKSSLVKAGLIPRLQAANVQQPSLDLLSSAPTKSPQWSLLALLRPGELPWSTLNRALRETDAPLAAMLPDSSELEVRTFIESLKDWQSDHPNMRLLLVIDQFEELITLCRKDEEREQFLDCLVTALATCPNVLHILLTLRSDFEAQFRDTALKPEWKNARFLVPAMTREELRQVIEEPASASVMYFEPHSLVDQLIDEVAQTPGALPLLSFALSQLYFKLAQRYAAASLEGKIVDRAITQIDYEEMGGVTRSLTQRADEECRLLIQQDPAYEQTIQHVMLRMVSISGGELARRRVLLSELQYPEPENGQRKAVIQCFSAARLLTGGIDVDDRPYIEPTHDALIQGWRKLRNWKDQALADLVLQRELTPISEKWATEKRERRSIGLLWDDDPRLPLLKQVLDSEHNWLNLQEIEFVQSSLRRRRNNRYRLASITAGVIASLAGLSMFALIQLQFSVLREKAANVRNQLAAEPLNSLILAIQATGESASRLRQVLNPVQFSLSSAVTESREQLVIRGHRGAVLSVAFSPDHQTIVSGGEDGTVRLWDLTGKSIRVLQGHEEKVWSEGGTPSKRVNAVAFSPNGQMVASGGDDGTVRLWDLQGNQIALMKQHPERVSTLAFSPDGNSLVSSSQDGTILLWNLSSGVVQSLNTEKQQYTYISHSAVAFSPNGEMVAGIVDSKLILWDLEGEVLIRNSLATRGNQVICSLAFDLQPQSNYSRKFSEFAILTGQCRGSGSMSVVEYKIQRHSINLDIRSFNDDSEPYLGHSGDIESLAVSINGVVASGGRDKTIRLWRESANPPPVNILRGHTDVINTVAFSSDGNHLVSASDDGTIRLWDVSDFLKISYPNIDKDNQYYDFIYSVSFSPDDKLLAIAFRDTVILSDLQGKPVTAPFKGHKDGGVVSTVAFSPDGKTIVSGSSDKTLRLWNLKGEVLTVFQGHGDHINSVIFSPDGTQIASSSTDQTVRLWHLDGSLINTFKGHQEDVNSVAFSPDGKTIVSASNDKTLHLWDLQGNTLHIFRGHQDRVNSVVFSPDGKTIVSGGADNNLRLWNLKGQPTGSGVIRGHSAPVKAVAFTPDGNMIVSASTDRTVMFSGLDGSPLLPTYTGSDLPILYSVMSMSSNGKMLLLSMGGSAKEIPSSLSIIQGWSSWQDWLKIACDRLRYHPALTNPQTDTERGARATCQQRVWR